MKIQTIQKNNSLNYHKVLFQIKIIRIRSTILLLYNNNRQKNYLNFHFM